VCCGVGVRDSTNLREHVRNKERTNVRERGGRECGEGRQQERKNGVGGGRAIKRKGEREEEKDKEQDLWMYV